MQAGDAGAVPAGSTNSGASSNGKASGSNPEDVGSIPTAPANNSGTADDQLSRG